MTETADRPIDKSVRISVWALYCLIVFEILFMVSPFALYYYSIYSIPLNWLQQSTLTGWLTLHILPHFTFTESVVSNALLLVSWPLILSGILLFLWGFVQIYWAKFIQGGTHVLGGLYRYIRHPQYLALAIVGLGTTIYWSRFIVLVAYVSMLFLYYFLARHEEEVCLGKYGTGYQEYLDSTGMFFPKRWLSWWPQLPSLLPVGGWRRLAGLVIGYVCVVGTAVAGGWWLKHHVLEQVTMRSEPGLTLMALAPASPETMAELQALVSEDLTVRSERERLGLGHALGYVAPSSWTVPELGLRPQGEHRHGGLAELLHPTIHGNSLDFDESQWTVLIMEPVLIEGASATSGKEMVLSTLGYVPKLKVSLDLTSGSVQVTDEPYESGWKGIPVPVY